MPTKTALASMLLKLVVVTFFLFSCGEAEESEETEAGPNATEGTNKWTTEQMYEMNQSCKSSVLSGPSPPSEANAYNRCGCLNESAAKRWTWDEFAKNTVGYMGVLEADGTIAGCKKKYP